jgi:hypothetical protein
MFENSLGAIPLDQELARAIMLNATASEPTEVFRILAVDGGGIKGLIPLTILDAMEKATGKTVPEMFNMVVGASIGSFVVAGLTTPGANGSPKRSLECRSLLYEMANHIFPDVLHGGAENLDELGKFLRSLNHILYGDAHGLRDFAKKLVGENAKLESAVIPTLLTAYDIIAGKPVAMRSWESPLAAKLDTVSALMSSGACPVYFNSITINANSFQEEPYDGDLVDAQKCLIDGGALGISPALFGVLELQDQLRSQGYKYPRIYLLSVGTGVKPHLPPLIDPRSVSKRGASWLLPIVSVLLDGMAEVEDKALISLLGDDYHRIQTDMWQASRDFDRVGEGNTRSNCDALIEDAKVRIQQSDFEAVCEFFKNSTKPTIQFQNLAYGELQCAQSS